MVLGGISWFDPGFEAVSRTLDPKINKCCKFVQDNYVVSVNDCIKSR